MKIACISLVVGIFCLKISSTHLSTSPRAIQIISSDDHSLQLKDDLLKSILENENIKDRHIVVVSIAGGFRQGKSFLLNFKLKYLDAQVIRFVQLIKSMNEIDIAIVFQLIDLIFD